MDATVTLENVIVPPPGPGEKLDFRALFGDDQPVEMEIGSGKGGFLLRRARALPDRRFFGIEWANQFYKYAADRMVRWQVSNVRLMRTDARHLVIHHLPPECLTILHIYHPDPWPKKRHHKRRLIQPPFVAAAADALVPGGRIAIQTDHADYFEQIRRVLGAEPRLAEVPFDIPEAGVVDGRVETNYEIKYLREGRAIYRLAVVKAASAPQSPVASTATRIADQGPPGPRA
jgi:tRNA (guanine-N7-)-methyltransferase